MAMWILGSGMPQSQGLGNDPEVVVASHQRIGDSEDRLAEAAISPENERSVGEVDGAALIPRGVEAGAAGDRASLGVGGDRSGLGGELGGRDDVQPGNAQEDQVGGFGQVVREGDFDLGDLTAFGLEIGDQVDEDGPADRGPIVGFGGDFGPGEDGVEGLAMATDAGGSGGVGELVGSGRGGRRW